MNEILTKINDVMYTYVLIVLLAGVGIYFTIRTKGVQLRLFKDAIRSLMEKAGTGTDGKKKVSSFQALMISTASRVGTGNIAGIATAIAAGGPGAVFWMWVMAVIGGASAFVESTLAQIYKVKDGEGFRGGPSYYMEKALGKRWLGILFSVLLIICFAYGFNGVIWGGVHRIGFITSVMVPVMATIYILIGLVTMVLHIRELPQVFAMILENAFDFQAMAGALAGSAVVIGIKRGLFSNEAGMGSAPNASASAEVDHPVKQGLVQVISVFIDTLLICSSTAMMLLVSGVEGKPEVLDGIPFVQAAIRANVGEWGIHFITFSIFAFAFSSLVGNYYYAESNILFIKNNKVLLFFFRISCIVAIFLGTQADFSLMWNIADITMGCMAIVNIVAIFLLGGIVFRALDHYEKQRKSGKPIKFKGKDIGISDTVWK